MSLVKELDLYVKSDQLHEAAVQITRRIKTSWPSSSIQVKTYTDGITNRLLGCYLPESPDEVVLIRVYGEKTELFIDRKIEIRNMLIMHQAGLSPPLYCSFKNGICYGYTPGRVLDLQMVRDEQISRLIAEKLAQMHLVGEDAVQLPLIESKSKLHNLPPVRPSERRPMLFEVLRRYLQLLPSALKDARQQNRR